MNHRERWLAAMERVARPVLDAAAERKFREKMPIQEWAGTDHRESCYFEAAGRLLCGIAPWLEADLPDGPEKELQKEFAEKSRQLILDQVDPASPDYANFEVTCRLHSQILVDAAFMAQGILRAPKVLWEELPEEGKQQVIAAFKLTRRVAPWFNNWLLFSAEVEAALKMMTGEFDPMRVDYAVRQHDQWYAGDGFYEDGPGFALDYYNSFVIHPMMLDVTAAFPELVNEELREKVIRRAIRFGAIQEKMIAADGTFIVVGRSMAYRCGAFHLLGQLALEHRLPEELAPAAVRCGMTAVIENTLVPVSFREDGFLKIGICGDQPSIAETYICTGSLYLCAAAFLPLGLSPQDPFWIAPDAPWTQKKIWAGFDHPADHKVY